MKKYDLDTPSVLIDIDQMERNIKGMADFARANGIKLRPHTKTHKSTFIAHEQLKAGAGGITVAKLSEAEVMISSGIDDIFVAYTVVGREKLERLMRLMRFATIAVGVDSIEGAKAISEVAIDHGRVVDVLIEVDTGLGRCGVTPGDAAVRLAERISDLRGIRLRGLFTHAGHGSKALTPDDLQQIGTLEGGLLVDTARLMKAHGIFVNEISVGSTPTCKISGRVKGVTEIRPGTYVFNDGSLVGLGLVRLEECALSILTTIISRPADDRAVLDAGSKALSSDKEPIPRIGGHGIIKESPHSQIERLYEEHGVVKIQGDGDVFKIGRKVEVVPMHVCPVVNLADYAYLVSGEDVVGKIAIDARGRAQ